jgi:hypothetical protein
MAEDEDVRMPTHDRPLNGPRRPTVGPLAIALLLLAVIAVVFLVLLSMTPDPAQNDPYPAEEEGGSAAAVTAQW